MAAQTISDQLAGPNGWDVATEWIARREPESLHLDFKCVEGGAGVKGRSLADQQKEQLAVALSAFANTEGGVLVLGVHAPPAKKGDPDRAASIQGIEDVGADGTHMNGSPRWMPIKRDAPSRRPTHPFPGFARRAARAR